MIETERLLLRKPSLDDLDGFARAFADPETMRYLGTGRTVTRDQVEQGIPRWLEAWEANGLGLFSVDSRATGELLGRVGFLVWDTTTWDVGSLESAGDRAEVELGWTIFSEHRRNGYATEAALALRDWALAERGLPRLISLIRPGNVPSVRVAEKIGESFEREVVLMGQPALLYALAA